MQRPMPHIQAESAPEDSKTPDETPALPAGKDELRIFQALRRIIRAIEIHSQSLKQGYQITGPQLTCLLAIRKEQALTAKRLSNTVFLSPSTVVGIVDRLEEKGLVSRLRSTVDRRQIMIALTPAGHRLAECAPSPLQETIARGLQALPPAELENMTQALDRLVGLMEAGEISAAPILETGPLLTENAAAKGSTTTDP